MLEFLQTGKALYVLAAICGLGILAKWLTRNLYKRLIKETDNMSLTKNKNLRAFKQKAESTYQMNQGIPKARPFVERQMYDFKFMRIPLGTWTIFSNQMTLWCFLAGGAAAFASYWFKADPYFIVLYGSVGILTGLFTILVDHGAGITEKQQQLFVALDNYMENHLIYRLDKERKGIPVTEVKTDGRDNIRAIYPQEAASSAAELDGTSEPVSRRQRTRAERMKNQLKAEVSPRSRRDGNGVREEKRDASRDVSEEHLAAAQDTGTRGSAATEPASSRRDIDYLKRSLEQIAASRERDRGGRSKEELLKDLTPEELNLIGEILKEYLT